MAALLPPEQKPLLLALASRAWPGTGQAFQSGASRIIYRPLDPEQLKDALASGRKKAKQQRRRVARYETKTLVHLDFESASIPAITIDISEHGLALQATEPVPISSHVPFRCVLPGTHETLQGVAEVIWASDQGRAGLFFARLTPAGRKHLKEWLHRRSHASHSARNGNGTRTDHVQELLPPAEAKVSFSVSE